MNFIIFTLTYAKEEKKNIQETAEESTSAPAEKSAGYY